MEVVLCASGFASGTHYVVLGSCPKTIRTKTGKPVITVLVLNCLFDTDTEGDEWLVISLNQPMFRILMSSVFRTRERDR